MISNSLVLFYSWSGNTRRAARIISKKAGAELAELQPVTPYPPDRPTALRRAEQERRERTFPALRPLSTDWRRYETVFLGTPNWCDTPAPPIFSFLYQAMPLNKSIIPFCTHDGGGAGKISEHIAHYCIGCDILPLLALRGNDVDNEQQIDRWLSRVEHILELLHREYQSRETGF